MLTLANDRFLIYAGAGVRSHKLAELVNVNPRLGIAFQFLFALGKMAVLGDDNLIGADGSDLAAVDSENDCMRVPRNFCLKAGADQRHLGNNQWHALALHVGTHQSTVRVVMFQKRDKSSRYRKQMLR